MCRNIKQLRRAEAPPTDEEIELAALQFVRKVSGYRAPSKKNQAAFDQAVAEVAAATRALMEKIEVHPEGAKAAKRSLAVSRSKTF